MRGSRAGALLLWAALAWPRPGGAAAWDPQHTWRTLETEHFRITFHGGEERLAEEAAAAAERAWAELTEELETAPRGRVEVVLVDPTDSANGYATILPVATIVIFVTAPGEDGTLSLYEDWNEAILTHELTHILHMDTVEGIPRALRRVFGRVVAVNALSPGWIIEGQATLQETWHTTGGRGRSTFADLVKRVTVLEQGAPRLGNLDGWQTEPPGGNLRYLFGQDFQQFVADRVGRKAWTRFVHAYGAGIPYLLPGRRTFGRSIRSLHREWAREIEARYARQAERVRVRGETRYEVLSDGTSTCEAPAWSPDGRRAAWSCTSPTDGPAIFVWEDGEARVEVPRRSASAIAWRRDGEALLYSTLHPATRWLLANDVYLHEIGAEDDAVLTRGERARDPAPAPDGGRLLVVTNELQDTQIAALGADRLLERLTAQERHVQFGGLALSPDGRALALTAWVDGRRDIWIASPEDGRPLRQVTVDAALDLDPAWSADGRWLFFSSDRVGGIPNIFAVDLETERLWQVTNVVGGAFRPAPSPDGRWLLFEAWSAHGADIARIPLDPATWRDLGVLPRPLHGADAPLSRFAAAGRSGGEDAGSGAMDKAGAGEPGAGGHGGAGEAGGPVERGAAEEAGAGGRGDGGDGRDGGDGERGRNDGPEDDGGTAGGGGAGAGGGDLPGGSGGLAPGAAGAWSPSLVRDWWDRPFPGIDGLGGPFWAVRERLGGPWGLPLEPRSDQPAPAPGDDRLGHAERRVPEERDYPFAHPVRRYTPLPSLLPPRFVAPAIYRTSFGWMGVLGTGGVDVLRWIAYSGYVSYRTDSRYLGWGASAALNRWAPVFSAGAWSDTVPYGRIYRVPGPPDGGGGWVPSVVGADERYWDRRLRTYAQVAVPVGLWSGLYAGWRGTLREPLHPLDPSVYRPFLPTRGFLSAVGVGWRTARTRSYRRSISPEDGHVFTASAELTSSLLGSRVLDDQDRPQPFDQLQAAAEWREYLGLPWGANHVLAWKLAGGATLGDRWRYGSFRLGGSFGDAAYATLPDEWRALRGFPPASSYGDWYGLGSVEYRMPLLTVNRGAGLLPFFVRTVSLAAFGDAGEAAAEPSGFTAGDLLVGTGAELRASLVVGWWAGLRVRLGYGFAVHGPGGYAPGDPRGLYAWLGSSF